MIRPSLRPSFRAVRPRDLHGSMLVSTHHAYSPRVTADFAVLDERAHDIRFDVDVDLLAAVRTRHVKLVGHSRDRLNNAAMVASASGSLGRTQGPQKRARKTVKKSRTVVTRARTPRRRRAQMVDPLLAAVKGAEHRSLGHVQFASDALARLASNG